MNSKLFGIGVAFVAAVSLMSCSAKDTYSTDTAVLPDAAMSVINDNYKDTKVSQIKIDREVSGDDYEVVLANGTKLEFDKSGALVEAKAGQNDSVPLSLIPQPIQQYLSENYAGQKVMKIEFGSKDTELTLASGIELQFTPQGEFVKID